MNCIVWGLGIYAAKIIYSLEANDDSVLYVITNEKQVDFFCGYKVYDATELNLSKVGAKLIVATSEFVYYEIVRQQLVDSGLREFEDFVYADWINKKIVLLHGNCHVGVVKEYLLSSACFAKEYAIYNIPQIQSMKEKIDENVLKNVDVFVHQDIQDDNKYGFYLSDTYILPKMKKDVINIVIPNLFGMGETVRKLTA